MASVGINFGSATSGAGFDVASTVSSIMALERTPETAWANQTAALQAQDTALTALGTNASSLSTALSSLTSFDGVFSRMQGATSDPSAVALTSVGSTAQSGTHSMSVTRLAITAQQYSSAIGPSASLSGTLTLQTAGATAATTISVLAGSSLRDVAAQINRSAAGVQAAVLSDSTGQYLSLTSKQSGAAGDLAVSSSMQDSGGNGVSFSVAQAGSDAQYKLDGVSLTSGSNTISGALPGVSLQLTGVSSGVTLQIAPDESGIETALQSFVSAYNTLSKSLAPPGSTGFSLPGDGARVAGLDASASNPATTHAVPDHPEAGDQQGPCHGLGHRHAEGDIVEGHDLVGVGEKVPGSGIEAGDVAGTAIERRHRDRRVLIDDPLRVVVRHDFPGRAPASHAKQPQPQGEKPDQASAPPSEPAVQSLKRSQDERAGRPDAAGQRSEPRQENPVHEHGKSQDIADPTNSAKT